MKLCLSALLCALLLAGACTSDDDNSGGAVNAREGFYDTLPPPDTRGSDAGEQACGDTSCGADSICVHPCSCGVQQCLPLPDGGSCPDGYSLGTCDGHDGCLGCPPPPAPFCAPRPAGCSDACNCFSTDPCQAKGGGCGLIDDTGIACICA